VHIQTITFWKASCSPVGLTVAFGCRPRRWCWVVHRWLRLGGICAHCGPQSRYRGNPARSRTGGPSGCWPSARCSCPPAPSSATYSLCRSPPCAGRTLPWCSWFCICFPFVCSAFGSKTRPSPSMKSWTNINSVFELKHSFEFSSQCTFHWTRPWNPCWHYFNWKMSCSRSLLRHRANLFHQKTFGAAIKAC